MSEAKILPSGANNNQRRSLRLSRKRKLPGDRSNNTAEQVAAAPQAHRPIPGASAFTNDCGILPSE